MNTFFYFIKTVGKKVGHYAIIPIKAYLELSTKSYEKTYGKGYTGPIWR